MKKLLLLATIAAASFAQAAIIEDFEHNNPALYTSLNGSDSYVINGTAAFSGSFGGATDSFDFFARSDVATSAGFVYSAKVRATGPIGDPQNISSAGRIYMGIGASATGMWSAVFAPNSGEIMIQDNNGFGFNEFQHTAVAGMASNTWYTLSLLWAGNGDMQVSLYDSTGTSLMAQSGVEATGFTTSGWLGSRSFGGNHLDDIDASAVPEPATLVAIGAGLALFAVRRRK